jgi:hypothetical protein
MSGERHRFPHRLRILCPASHLNVQTVPGARGRLFGLVAATLVMPVGIGSAAVRPSAAIHAAGPLVFEATGDQTDGSVTFIARGAAYTAFLASTEAVLALHDGRRGRTVVRLKPFGGNPAPRLVGDGEPSGVVAGDRGDRVTPMFRAVRYVDVYPGIDLVYYGERDRLEYDFVVAPGADPRQIALTFDGVDRIRVDDAGTLVAGMATGDVRQPRPVVYQDVDGVRRRVSGDFVVDRAGRVRFRLGAYDPSRPLVIDPVIAYSSYLGGAWDEADYAFEGVVAVALDGAGNVYLTGTTQSPDFPTTAGADRTLDGEKDVFVTKLAPDGHVVYSTYLGGSCDDVARAIAVDPAGNAYVTGRLNGGQCYLDVPNGVLVAKLDPAGNLVYASVFGGRLADSSIGQAIAVDTTGHAYVAGVASSDTHDFPTTPGAFRTVECANVYPFAGDVFVSKLSADGTAFEYSTIICGTGDEGPDGIAVDAAGHAYVAGTTASSDFPLVHPIVATRGGGSVGVTGFVTKLDVDGSRLLYSTYLGGSESAAIAGIALDPAGNAYVTGETDSMDFPTTPGALQPQPGVRHCIEGCTDAFVSKLDPTGSALVYSTYLYGELWDAGRGIAVDAGGHAYVVGTTESSYFPILRAFQTRNRGLDDVFVAKLEPDGSRLAYASYLGGSGPTESPRVGHDDGTGIAIDGAGNAYVVGYTQSVDFPTTPGAFQGTIGSGVCDVMGTVCGDAFVTKITAGGAGVVPPLNVSAPATAAPGGTLLVTWTGIPAPGPDDWIEMFALGAGFGPGFGDPVAWHRTNGAAGGTLWLDVPPDVPPGWYEVRLVTPNPDFSNLPAVVARSEPIRIDPAATTTTTTTRVPTTTTHAPTTTTQAPTTTTHEPTSTTRAPTTTTSVPTTTTNPPTTTTIGPTTTTVVPTTTTLPVALCAAGGCDDGDPCTDDVCVPDRGCTSTPASGFASVTCTCRRPAPTACAGLALPAAIGIRVERVCTLFVNAAETPNRATTVRRLKKATKTLKATMRVVTRSGKRGVPAACVVALTDELQDSAGRAERLLVAIGS